MKYKAGLTYVSSWRRRVFFPPLLVNIPLLGSGSRWQRCLSGVLRAQPQQLGMPPARGSTAKHSEVEQRRAARPEWPSPSPALRLVWGQGRTSHTPRGAFLRPAANSINQPLQSLSHLHSVFSTRSITVAVTMRDGLVWGKPPFPRRQGLPE